MTFYFTAVSVCSKIVGRNWQDWAASTEQRHLKYKWLWNWPHELQSSFYCVHKGSFCRWQKKLSQTSF